MKLTGQIRANAPRERVFAAMRDAEFFASCVQGVSDLKEIDDRNYTAVLKTKVAYIRFSFDVEVTVTRIEEPVLIEAQVTGTPAGIVGRLTSTATTELIADGDETIIDYVIDSHLTGRLGSIGQPVLKSKAREMEREFTKRLREAFALESTGGGAQ
ncbi:CoxG family protein [Celeribacter indicus]|uniref:Carbon monoxide dehydrogenase subunit G n=1 Tax=Celeribacter indicus TaxID=1208324 RepID=A0A0B5DNT4_9RHOB|nr:SRPBCC domain-containing protein [Celeribacter indicus]AJE44879.1 carbon monoxide dehydrogenase subunit G [Celeribacter indicus]SDX22921.1 hypothetical protein SAMN05443573_11812 [Celeribacter indicus]